MIQYYYDGTFEGFLTLIYTVFKSKDEEFKVFSKKKLDFFNSVEIETDVDKASDVCEGITKKISKLAFRKVVFIFLSKEDNFEKKVISFLRSCFKKGKGSDNNNSDDKVLYINKLYQRVTFEIHRLKGLLRFKELKDGTFYAPLEPDYDIIVPLSKHFEERFSDQKWVIHDIKREYAVIYQDNKSEIVKIVEKNKHIIGKSSKKSLEFYSENEIEVQNLFKKYFEKIAIKERRNLNLQKQYMPKRYWKFIIEKQ